MFEMKVDKNGYSDDCQVDGESKPGQECAFVGTVVPCIGGNIWKEERRRQGARKEELQRVRL